MTPARDTPGRIIHLWTDISRLLRRRMLNAARMSSERMNPMQVHGMLVIAEHPGITMKELAEHLHVTSPSATSFVDRLVKQKWVTRSSDPRNRKLVRLNPLPAGVAALDRAVAEHSAAMRDVFLLLSDDDQAQFERVLKNLKDALARGSALPVPSRTS